MTNDKALSLVPQILGELKKIKEAEDGHGLLCVDELEHAIECGKLLNLAKETVTADVVEGKKAKWSPWLQTHIGMPQTTASLYMRLAKHEELLFEHKQRVATQRLSIRQAAQLIPKDEKAKKQSATAAEKAAQRQAAKEAAVRQAVVESLSTVERVGDLALDDVFEARGDIEVDEIFMTLKSKLDKDQLLDLATRLRSHLDKLDEEEAKREADEKAAADAERQRQFEEMRARNQPQRRV